MKKYLDILIFTLLFFVLFSFFTGNNNESTPTGIQFEAGKNSYSVPAGVSLSFTNGNDEKISLNTCEDLTLRYGGGEVMLPESVCSDIEILRGDTYILDLSKQYELFSEPGNYVFELNVDNKKLIDQFEVGYRGTVGKVFVGLFYAPVYNLLVFLISTFSNSLGFAIIAITVLIRILLLFPQHKMMVSQRKMQAIQPKIKKLQEKHKGNQQAMGMELMKLYKTEGVNPMGSCGFLIIQMPILLVIYNILININSLKNEFYLYNPLSNFSISQIDFNFFGLDLLGSGGVAGLILALSVAAIQYVQVRLSLAGRLEANNDAGVVLEKKKGEKDYSSMMPDPDMMNKFMLYGMPLMVGVFTFSLAAGVGVYWGVSTLFATLQQLFVNKIIKK